MNKNIVIGMLAHVDAGKTTLSEAILYKTHTIKKQGRVDSADAFLDTDKIEKERGITIFSKQAVFKIGDKTFFLQDTPGHIDFSSETERSLRVLDVAVIIVSACDGISSYTELLMALLKKNKIPFIVFVNKTDLPHEELTFDASFINFPNPDYESLALCSDDALDEFVRLGTLSDSAVTSLFYRNKFVPVFYGSALRLEGIDTLLQFLNTYVMAKEYPPEFGALCFKITRNSKGARQSWLKITGGKIQLRDTIDDEKITAIELLSGIRHESISEMEAGGICAVTGLDKSYAGKGYGFEHDLPKSDLIALTRCRVRILDGTDSISALKKLRDLCEEDPLLDVRWNDKLSCIEISIMGNIQNEVLTRIISDRLGMDVSIEHGSVVYKETVAAPVKGCGHFEPLRHYAEVHLLIEPAERGAGLIFENVCSDEILSRNWQNLIMYNLSEYVHKGVLTGAELTDVKITLVAGRAHLKHTEGGDFRQAALRAVRQALMKAENVLLEPYYDFTVKAPPSDIGRVISDLKLMGCHIEESVNYDLYTQLKGIGPVSELSDYRSELLSLTRGRGELSYVYAGYYNCHNTKAVLQQTAYDPDRDADNQSSSVFCSHGSGTYVSWDKCEKFMHLDSGLRIEEDRPVLGEASLCPGSMNFDEKELDAVIQKEFGAVRKPLYVNTVFEGKNHPKTEPALKKDYYIIDAYNLIFSASDSKKLDAFDLASEREKLIDALISFKSMKKCELLAVFDGYKIKGNQGSKYNKDGVLIVYTKEAVSADAYIEKLVNELGNSYNVKVVSSDALVQLTALRKGTRRMSSREFLFEMAKVDDSVRAYLNSHRPGAVKLSDIADIS